MAFLFSFFFLFFLLLFFFFFFFFLVGGGSRVCFLVGFWGGVGFLCGGGGGGGEGIGIYFYFFKLICMKFSTVFYSVLFFVRLFLFISLFYFFFPFYFSVIVLFFLFLFAILFIFWCVLFFFLFSLLGFYLFLSFFFFLFLIFSAFGDGCFTLEADWVFSTLFCFFNLSCKQTYVSCRLGHVVPDDVVIADIGGQASDIFLHGPKSTHKNGIVKTFTHTSFPVHPCTLLKQRAKPSTHQTWRLHLVVLFLSSVVVGDGQEAWQMLLSTAPTSEASSPRTVLT